MLQFAVGRFQLLPVTSITAPLLLAMLTMETYVASYGRKGGSLK